MIRQNLAVAAENPTGLSRRSLPVGAIAGTVALPQVFEAQSHAQFLTPFAPETEEAFGEITRFFDARLAS